MFKLRKFLWELTQCLHKDAYVESVHWYGYRVSKPYGLGFHGTEVYWWNGTLRYWFVD